MSLDSREIFLGRQPILDRNRQLFAYELLFRSCTRNAAEVVDDSVATATVITHMVGELGIAASLGPYRGFINVDAAMLASETIELLPVDRVVLEVLEGVQITPAVVHRCRALKDMGFQLALDDFVALEPQYFPLLEFVDIVKIDLLALPDNALGALVMALKRWPVRLLAEKVETDAQAQDCSRRGFDYFARPAVLSSRKLNSSELGLIRLMGLVLDDSDTGLIEDAFKREPALAINLLKLCNSAALGLRGQSPTLRQAIAVLGRRQLQRWLQLALYASGAGAQGPGYLLTLAATRGRLMENLATKLGKSTGLADHAYITGVLSLLPALFGVAIEPIIAPLNIGEEVRAALVDKRGLLGDLLLLAEAADSGDMVAYAKRAGQLPGISNSVANSCLTEALAWANSLTAEL
jgi:EAL and modified HD-GYP domain-containing signal transduction protein